MDFEEYASKKFTTHAERMKCVDDNVERIRTTMFMPDISPQSAEYKQLNKELNSFMCEMVKLGGSVYV